MRCVIARVLPVPAPASTQTGPSSVSAARRCSSSRPSSRSSRAHAVGHARQAPLGIDGAAVPVLDEPARDRRLRRAARTLAECARRARSRVNQRSSRISSPSGAGRRRLARGDVARKPTMRMRGTATAGCRGTPRRSTTMPGLLEHLADDRGLERLARLDEPGEQREPVLPPRARSSRAAAGRRRRSRSR